MTTTGRCWAILLILGLMIGFPFGCCENCDDEDGGPTDPDIGPPPYPNTVITSGPSGTVNTGDVTFTFIGLDGEDDPEALVYSYRLDPQDSQWSDYSSSTMAAFSGLTDGTYTFRVRARDTDGNVDPTPAERTFTVDTSGGGDTTPPETDIVDGPDGTVNTSDVYFEWSGTDNVDPPDQLTFSYRMDGAGWSEFSEERSNTFTGLADGDHHFEVRARDTSGNIDPTPASRNFTVDTTGGDTPPDTTITSGPCGETIDTDSATFGWTGSDDIDPPSALVFSWQLDGGGWSGWSSATSTTITGLTDGTHQFCVRARDTSGNVDPSPACCQFSVDTGGGSDDIPPDVFIDNCPDETLSDSDYTFQFHGQDNVDPPSALVFSWQLDGGGWSSWSAATSAALTGLSDGAHVFQVRARDTAGNIGVPDSCDFSVDTGGSAGVEFDFPSTSATGDPGETVIIEGSVYNNTGVTADFRFSISYTSTTPDWDVVFCVAGVCFTDPVVVRTLPPGESDVSVDVTIPNDASTGDSCDADFRVELVSDPSVNDQVTVTVTSN